MNFELTEKILKEMINTEKNFKIKIDDNSQLKSNIGIFNYQGLDRIKIMINMIKKDREIENKEMEMIVQKNEYFEIEKKVIYNNKTIIICANYVMYEWINKLNVANIKYVIFNRNKNIEKYEVIICSPLLFNFLSIKYLNYKWKRIIYEEPIINKLKNVNVYYEFLWLLTNNPYNILIQGRNTFLNVFINNITSFELYKKFIIENKKDLNLNSIYNDYILKYRYKCFENEEINYKSLENNQIINKIFNNIQEYTSHYNIEKIWENKCIICMNTIENLCILSCCHSQFCYHCIVCWFKNKKTCPICRRIILNDYLNRIDEYKINNLKYLIKKDETILKLLNHNDKFLIILKVRKEIFFLNKLKDYKYKIIKNKKYKNIENEEIIILDDNKEYQELNLDFISKIIFYQTICPIKHDLYLNFVNKNRKNLLKIFYF